MEAAFEFENRLEVFRSEVESGAQYFYAYMAIHAELNDSPALTDRINETPLLWLTILSGLQVSFFITLGRVFDDKSAHNVHALIKYAQSNPDVFSRDELGARKRSSTTSRDWLEEYQLRKRGQYPFQKLKRVLIPFCNSNYCASSGARMSDGEQLSIVE